MWHSAGRRAEPSEILLKKKKKKKIKAKVYAFHYGTNFLCSLLAAIIQLYGSKNPTATNVRGQSAGYSVSYWRSEVVSLILFQKWDIIFPFSQCQSCSGKCYSFCKCKLKTIITWLTYSIIKMPGTTHLPVEWRFAAMIFTWVGKCSSLDAVDMLIVLIKEGKSGSAYLPLQEGALQCKWKNLLSC